MNLTRTKTHIHSLNYCKSSTWYGGNSHTHLQWCLIMLSQRLHLCGLWPVGELTKMLHQTEQLQPPGQHGTLSLSLSTRLRAPSAVAASLSRQVSMMSTWRPANMTVKHRFKLRQKHQNPKGLAQTPVPVMSSLTTVILRLLRQSTATIPRWSSGPKTYFRWTGLEYIRGLNLTTVKWAARFVKCTLLRLLSASVTKHQL